MLDEGACTSRSLDACNGAADHAGELCAILAFAPLTQSFFGFLHGKPCAISIGFFRCAEPPHFTKMGTDRETFGCGSNRTRRAALSPVGISYERSFFDPSMNSRFLEGLDCRRLSMGKSGFGPALGEGPASAASSLHQQEFNRTAADAVADCGYLLTFAHLVQLR